MIRDNGGLENEGERTDEAFDVELLGCEEIIVGDTWEQIIKKMKTLDRVAGEEVEEKEFVSQIDENEQGPGAQPGEGQINIPQHPIFKKVTNEHEKLFVCRFLTAMITLKRVFGLTIYMKTNVGKQFIEKIVDKAIEFWQKISAVTECIGDMKKILDWPYEGVWTAEFTKNLSKILRKMMLKFLTVCFEILFAPFLAILILIGQTMVNLGRYHETSQQFIFCFT